MRIGVLSDTHLHLPEELPHSIVEALADVDLIVHAGDFVELEVLEGLRRLGEVKAVHGNMDSTEIKSILPEREQFVINGKRIGIIHGWGAPWGIERRVREKFDEVDIIIYGHSHQSRNKVIEGVLFFNPGQAKHSFGILEIGEDVSGAIIKT